MTPPDYTYFKVNCEGGDPVSTNATISPGKQVNLRSQCMDQLDKSLSLLRKGCITQEQYDNLINSSEWLLTPTGRWL